MMEEPKDFSDAPVHAVVSPLGTVGVFLCDTSRASPVQHGIRVTRMVAAIQRLQKLERTLTLSGPKFEEAMKDDELRKELHHAVKDFVLRTKHVCVLSVKSNQGARSE